MLHPAEHSLLGKQTRYKSRYDASLLFAIERRVKWEQFGLDGSQLPYLGVDIWTAYELSWLLPSGKPVVAMAEVEVPADSPNIIESKSFKLYLNSFNQSVFADTHAVCSLMEHDLSAVAGAAVRVRMLDLDQATAQGLAVLPGACIDGLEIDIGQYHEPDAGLLQASEQVAHEQLHSHLLRSCCPVTGQPDWGSVAIDYQGTKKLCRAGLLRYLVSFREHQDFHEQCVERIFLDLYRLLEPERLTVHARYLRRGGLDINPYRSTHQAPWDTGRLVRQ